MKKLFLLCILSLSLGISQFTVSQTIQIGGLTRSYILHKPSDLDAGEKYPLIIALHFLGSNASGFESLTQFSKKADEEGFIVVYPQGIGNSWNAGGCCDPAVSQGINDVEFISALIDTLIAEQPVDSQKVFVTGFSNGGIMAYALASEITDKLAGIAPVGALLMMDENHGSKPLPIIHFHALDDGSVNFNGTSEYLSVLDLLDEWKTINGITAEPDTFRDDSGIKGILFPSADSTANIILYTSQTGGHNWEINSRLGTTNRIWEFFSSHINKVDKTTDTIIEGPRKRDYLIHIPNKYFYSVDETIKYPLIIAAHGWNSDAAGMEQMTKFSIKANSKNFFVTYLHYVGPPPDVSWNYFMNEDKPDDIGYAKAVIDSIFARYPIDSSRVFAIGFSDGCGMVNRLSQETDGLIKATGTVGSMADFGSAIQTTPVKMIHLHANNDPAVNYSTIRNSTLNSWLETDDCMSDPDTIYNEQGYVGEMWKNQANDTMVLFYTLPWNQHAWPVKNELGSLVSATDIIWDFFEKGIAIPTIPPLAINEINNTTAGSVTVFPNPASSKLTMTLNSPREDNLSMQIIQVNGQVIDSIDLGHVSVGRNQYEYNVKNLMKGYYLVHITGKNSQFDSSILVQ
jgi:polyhydroxybutyrate depolymerase